MSVTITDVVARDIRFPTSENLDGSDAMIQHLSIFDYIAVSASLEDRVLEYVDHLHKHFLDPVRIDNGRYRPPKRPGYSIEMYPGSLDEFEFPVGSARATAKRMIP